MTTRELEFTCTGVDVSATESLRKLKRLQAKNNGTIASAVVSAAFYAKKQQKTMFVYAGNSFMSLVYRVSSCKTEYLSPINNTGHSMFSISPDMVVSRYEKV